MKKIIILALALSSIIACSKSEDLNKSGNGNTVEVDGIHAIICTTPTLKTQLGTAEDDKYPVVWEANDAIKVYGSNFLSGVTYTNTETSGTASSATFYTPDSPVTDATRYAIYPASCAGAMSEGNISVDFGGLATQDWHSTIAYYGRANSIIGKAPMFASSSNETFLFNNLCGAITLRLNDYMGQAIAVTRVKLTVDKVVCGVASVDTDGHIVSMAGDDSKKVITMDYDAGAKISPSNYNSTTCNLTNRYTRFTFFLPIGTYNSFDFEITLKDGRVLRQSTSNAVTIEPGVIKPFPTLQFSMWYGHTNCYVTTPNTTIDVDITPYYNLMTLGQNDGHRKLMEGTIPALTPCLLWEMNTEQTTGPNTDSTQPSFVLSAAPAISGNTMTVQVGNKLGNALIGLKDPSGKVVWSYHIWVTRETPSNQNYLVGEDSFQMMDRDLGAAQTFTFDTRSAAKAYLCYGMFYQWGRKEPLPLLGTSTYETAPVCWFTSATPGNYTTIQNLLDNPLTTYSVNNAITTSLFYGYAEWGRLWGAPDSYSVSSFDGLNAKGTGFIKTIYDPCPEGYMVPQFYHFTALSAYTIAEDGSKSGRQGYCAWLKTGASGVESCYPLNGYLNPFKGSDTKTLNTYTAGTTSTSGNGSYSKWWTSTPYGSKTWSAAYLMIRYIKDEGVDTKNVIHVGPKNDTNDNRIHGYAAVHSVRCLKQ